MSSINLTTRNTNIKSCLSEDNLFCGKKISLDEGVNFFFSFNSKQHETKNHFNRLNPLKLKGKEKYKNFPIFIKREMEFDKNNKKKLTLNIKKISLSDRNINNNSIKDSLFLTENIAKGDYSKLPFLLKNINIKKQINKNQQINDKNKNNKNNLKKQFSNKKVELLFLNRLKNDIENDELRKKFRNKSNSNLLNNRNILVNRFKRTDNSNLIDKLNEFKMTKIYLDLKNEQLIQLNEKNYNKLEEINDKITSLYNAHKLFEEQFLTKFYEYIRALIIEKEYQNNKDIILCKYIYSLRTQIKFLENKITKIKKNKNDYVKWKLLQVQIKEKILNLPNYYITLFNDGYIKENITNEEKHKVLRYKNNIIFENSDELITQLKKYENNNINLIMKLNELNSNIFLLQKELEQENKENNTDYFTQEINNKIKIKLKLIEKNEKLKRKILFLKQSSFGLKNESNNNNFSILKYAKLYEKIETLKKNIIGEKRKNINNSNNINKEMEILETMKDIDMAVDSFLEKQKLYIEIYKNKFEKEKEKLEQDKKLERIKIHRTNLISKYINLKDKILKKSNKIYFIQNRNINYNEYKPKNIKKKSISIPKEKKEDLYDYIDDIGIIYK